MLTLTASSTAAFASSTVTITGTSGTLTASTTFQLLVVPPVFTLSVPGSMSLRPGSTSTTTSSFNGKTGSATTSVFPFRPACRCDRIALASFHKHLQPAHVDASSTADTRAIQRRHHGDVWQAGVLGSAESHRWFRSLTSCYPRTRMSNLAGEARPQAGSISILRMGSLAASPCPRRVFPAA